MSKIVCILDRTKYAARFFKFDFQYEKTKKETRDWKTPYTTFMFNSFACSKTLSRQLRVKSATLF